MKKIYAIGDIHGDIDRFKLLLSQNNIINSDENWNASDATFVSIGDLVDRGKNGKQVIKLIMKLEQQAKENGGDFITICGNHDAIMTAMVHEELGEFTHYDCGYLFRYNGGDIREARAIAEDEELFEWIKKRPLIYKIGNLLFQHADSAKYYLSLGRTVEEINNKASEMLNTGEGAWNIFAEMTDCRFWDRPYLIDDNALGHIEQYLSVFDVDTVIHGHTRFVGNEPQIYGDGKIINIDGSLSNGYRKDADRGFIVSFSENSDFFTFDKNSL